MTETEPKPEEIITVAFCTTCEKYSLPEHITGHAHLFCGYCDAQLSADELHDYVDISVVDYE